MFDYTNLSYIEFEELCKDILQKKLGQPLRTFAPGRDGGIDASSNQFAGGIVMQAKHYSNSAVSKLMRSIEGEKAKVDKLKPKAYYICCSRELTSQNVKSIYHLYKEYMVSPENVLTKRDLDSFLQQPQNRDILNIHFKLWLQSTSVLMDLLNCHVTVDSKVYMDDVAEMASYFVSTQWYQEGVTALENNKLILITGDPGVGKSTLTKMLTLYCVSKGYHLRHVSGNEPDSLKAAMAVDTGIKELVIMDDFLGQRYDDLVHVKEGSLLSLLKYIARNENKILIINTRMTVYRRANECFEKLRIYLKTHQIHEILIDGLSKEEKAKILYNHLLRNEERHHLPHHYYENIVANRAYEKIISHKNYSPRIIEMGMIPYQVKKSNPDGFVDTILARLDNPDDIWGATFADLNQEDRILLFVLFSLTQTTVADDVLRDCFWKRIHCNSSVDTTNINYERIQSRLIGSFLRFSNESSRYVIGFANSTIADYMASVFSDNESERENLIRSAVYYEQLFNCCQKDPNRLLQLLERIAKKEDILQYKTLYHSGDWTSAAILAIARAQVCKECYRELLMNWLQNHNSTHYERIFNRYTYGDIVIQLFKEPMYSFYRLNRYISDIEAYLSFIEFDSLEDTIKITNHILTMLGHDAYDELLPLISDQICEMIYDHVIHFDADSYCQERIELNDYHNELNRLREKAKAQVNEEACGEVGFFGETYYYADDVDSLMTPCLVSAALYNMAVEKLSQELQGYIDMVTNLEFKVLLHIPDPNDYLDESSFNNNIEGIFEFASYTTAYLSLNKETRKTDFDDNDKVERLFRDGNIE